MKSQIWRYNWSSASRDKDARWLCVHGALARCTFKTQAGFPSPILWRIWNSRMIGNQLRYMCAKNCRTVQFFCLTWWIKIVQICGSSWPSCIMNIHIWNIGGVCFRAKTTRKQTELAIKTFQVLGWVTTDRAISGMRGPTSLNLTRTYGHNGSIHFCFTVRIPRCVSKRGRLKVELFANDVENDAKFRAFDPTLWKLGEGWARSLWPIVEALPTTELRIHLMAIHCATAESGVLIKRRKKRKKESLWAKLNACRTNVGDLTTATTIDLVQEEHKSACCHQF